MTKKTLLVDQSSKCCGFAILDGSELVEHGVLISSKKTSTLRLLEFLADLRGLAWKFNVDEVVFEEINYHSLKTPDTIAALAPGEFICRAVAEELGLPWFRIPPPSWKSDCGLSGDVDDNIFLYRRILSGCWGIPEGDIENSDHASALGLAASWRIRGEDYRSGLMAKLKKERKAQKRGQRA